MQILLTTVWYMFINIIRLHSDWESYIWDKVIVVWPTYELDVYQTQDRQSLKRQNIHKWY